MLPFISIVIEKRQSLEEFGQMLNFSVEAYYGSEGLLPVPPGNHACIATIEKVISQYFSSLMKFNLLNAYLIILTFFSLSIVEIYFIFRQMLLSMV